MSILYYKYTNNPNIIKRLSDEAWIPFDISNIDYKEFLELCDLYGESEITEEV